ncbi:hypothetical protein BH11CYA1_BH11CYA1_35020 [soil metagenome]
MSQWLFKWLVKSLISLFTMPSEASRKAAAAAALATASRVNGFAPPAWGKVNRRGPPKQWPIDGVD